MTKTGLLSLRRKGAEVIGEPEGLSSADILALTWTMLHEGLL